MDGAIQQLLRLSLGRRHTASTFPSIHAGSTEYSAILAADKLYMVIPLTATAIGLAPPPGQDLIQERPANAQARDEDGDTRLDREPLERRHLGPGEVLLVNLQDGDETSDADSDVEDAEPEDERYGDFIGARHLQLPRCWDGERPDGELDGEAPCCDGGDDGDLGETCAGFGDVPVFGKGDAAEGDDEDGEEDPEDVDDVASEDWKSSQGCSSLLCENVFEQYTYWLDGSPW